MSVTYDIASMACYDITAEITVRVLMDIRLDATSKAEVEKVAAEQLKRWPQMLSDGSCYHFQIQSIKATRLDE